MHHSPPTDLAVAACRALQGRRYPPELLALIDALPADVLASDPWIALFQGRRLCRVHSRFAEATPLIDGALAAFKGRGDGDGELWALAEWVVMRYHEDDFAAGLAAVDSAIDRPTRPYLRAELLFGRFLCMIGSIRVTESIAAAEAGLAELDRDEDEWLRRIGRIQMLRNIAAGYHYHGEARRSVDAAEQAVAMVMERPDTEDMRPWCFYELGIAYHRQGRHREATETLDVARRLAEKWQHRELWRWAVAAQADVLLDQDRVDAALAAYQLAGVWGEDFAGPSYVQLRQGRLAEARWSCETLLELAERGRLYVVDAQMLLALVELQSGHAEAALTQLDRVCEQYFADAFVYHYAGANLYRAAAALVVGRDDIVDAGLREFLGFAARERVLTCAWWLPELVAPLLLYAVQRGIQSAWAQRLLAERFTSDNTTWFAPGSPQRAAELEIARRVQMTLLPELPPAMPDLEVAATVLPAVEVGGDFVAYFPRGADPETGDRRQLGIAVGDISGKGLGAALMLSGTVVALNTVVQRGVGPAKVAEALHQAMHPYTGRTQMNIALLYAMFEQHDTGWLMRAVGAGAIPPLVRRATGDTAWLETAGFPLGAVAVQRYDEVRIELRPGDVVLMLSDGVVEAMSAERELFGFDRLAEMIAALPVDTDAHTVQARVLEAVHRHSDGSEHHDDITLVVVRVLAGANGRAVYPT